MEDYPRSLSEFEACFATEQACRDYLFRLRWPQGFCCPRCGSGKSWPLRAVLLQCADCGYQISVTAGTIFQDTRTSLKVWFQAMWWVTTQKNGASALGLQRVLGLKQYQTAWTWLHKLRRAMVRPGRDLLAGRVPGAGRRVGLERYHPAASGGSRSLLGQFRGRAAVLRTQGDAEGAALRRSPKLTQACSPKVTQAF